MMEVTIRQDGLQTNQENEQLLVQNNSQGNFVYGSQINQQPIQQNYNQPQIQQQQMYQQENYQQQNIQIQQAQIQTTIISQIPIQQKIMTSEEAIQVLSANPIPDQFPFLHQFVSTSPTIEYCGGRNYECSTFVIPSIGELKWEVDFTMPCKCCEPSDPMRFQDMISRFIPQKAVTLNRKTESFQRLCCCRAPCNNSHFFSQLTYYLQNEYVRIEFQDNVGKFYILGVLILELVQCYPTWSDKAQASLQSTMPQMMVHQPEKEKNPRLRVKAEMNDCPEHPYSLAGSQSLCGCCKLQRNFEIFGLQQGECIIINRRQKWDACYSHCGYRDNMACRWDSCNFVDYPEFEVNFKNVTYIDRLKILFCLVHYSLYNKWDHSNYKGLHLQRQIARAQRAVANRQNSSCQLI